MRRQLAIAVVALAALAGACGSGQDPTLEAAPSTLPGSGVSTGDTAVTDSSVVGGDTSATTVGGATDTTAAPGVTTPLPPPPDNGGATFGPPVPGQYRFHTTGTSALNGNSQPVDEESVTVITVLNDTDARSAGSGQTTVMRYLPDQVQLLSLELTAPGVSRRFEANPPVLFVPIPPAVGASWSWSLTDTGGTTHVNQASTASRTETITVNGESVDTTVIDTTITLSGDLTGTIQLTSWLDLSRRTAVRARQVSDVRLGLFRATGDTTSEFVGFTPA